MWTLSIILIKNSTFILNFKVGVVFLLYVVARRFWAARKLLWSSSTGENRIAKRHKKNLKFCLSFTTRTLCLPVASSSRLLVMLLSWNCTVQDTFSNWEKETYLITWFFQITESTGRHYLNTFARTRPILNSLYALTWNKFLKPWHTYTSVILYIWIWNQRI